MNNCIVVCGNHQSGKNTFMQAINDSRLVSVYDTELYNNDIKYNRNYIGAFIIVAIDDNMNDIYDLHHMVSNLGIMKNIVVVINKSDLMQECYIDICRYICNELRIDGYCLVSSKNEDGIAFCMRYMNSLVKPQEDKINVPIKDNMNEINVDTFPHIPIKDDMNEINDYLHNICCIVKGDDPSKNMKEIITTLGDIYFREDHEHIRLLLQQNVDLYNLIDKIQLITLSNAYDEVKCTDIQESILTYGFTKLIG